MNCSCYSRPSVQLSYHPHGKCVNESQFLQILRYQLLSEPIDKFVTPPQTTSHFSLIISPSAIQITASMLPSHESSHHFTLYLPHELPTDLMLQCYLRDTSPSPVKLLVMEVCIHNSELHLHPIVLTLKVIPPPLVQQGTMPLSKRELIQLVPVALRHVWSRGVRYTHQRVEYIAQCRQYPAFPPISPHDGCSGIDAAPQAHVRLAKKNISADVQGDGLPGNTRGSF